MGFSKEAYIRYNIIDSSITNKYLPYPSMSELIDKCENILGKTFSKSTIQKDIKAMKEDEALGFFAPIKYSKESNGYYYTDSKYTIKAIQLNTEELTAIEAVSDILNVFSGSRIIDKSLEPTNGRIAVCYIDREFTLKRIKLEADLYVLTYKL